VSCFKCSFVLRWLYSSHVAYSATWCKGDSQGIVSVRVDYTVTNFDADKSIKLPDPMFTVICPDRLNKTRTHTNIDVLLTVHLSIFISVFNQLDAKNLFHNKFYFIPLHVSSTGAHHQEVKIALHSLWYHHIYR